MWARPRPWTVALAVLAAVVALAVAGAATVAQSATSVRLTITGDSDEGSYEAETDEPPPGRRSVRRLDVHVLRRHAAHLERGGVHRHARTTRVFFQLASGGAYIASGYQDGVETGDADATLTMSGDATDIVGGGVGYALACRST